MVSYHNDSQITERMLKDCIVFFDSSAILELYNYSLASNMEIGQILTRDFSNRVWTSSQVVYEVDYNKNEYINKSEKKYKQILDEGIIKYIGDAIDGDGFVNKYKGNLRTFKETLSTDKIHPYFEKSGLDELYQWLDGLLKDIENVLTNNQPEYRNKIELLNRLKGDSFAEISKIEKQITKTVESMNKTEEYTHDQLLGLSREAEFRFRNKIPPGYADADESSRNGAKPGFQKFADYFIWSDILSLAKSENKPLLLISSDSKKGDWNVDKDTPLPSLIREYEISSKGEQFWKINLDKLLYLITQAISSQKEATQYLNDEVMKNFLKYKISNYDFSELVYDPVQKYISHHYDEGNDFEVVDISVLQKEIGNIIINDYENVSLDLTVKVNAEAQYHDYWGRDEDTREAVVSPPNTRYYQGSLGLSLHLKVEQLKPEKIEAPLKILKSDVKIDTDWLFIDTVTWDQFE